MWLGIVLALVLGVMAVTKAPVVKEVTVEKSVGALAGPDIPFSYLNWGGAITQRGSMKLAQATTTVCAIQSPAATSTLEWAQFDMTTSSTTASVATVAKATTAFATTTLIGNQIEIAANAQANIVASTTAAQLAAGVHVFAPSTWLVLGMQGGVGTFSPVGNCAASWNLPAPR